MRKLNYAHNVYVAVHALRSPFPAKKKTWVIPDYQVLITAKVTITQSRVDFKKLKTHSHACASWAGANQKDFTKVLQSSIPESLPLKMLLWINGLDHLEGRHADQQQYWQELKLIFSVIIKLKYVRICTICSDTPWGRSGLFLAPSIPRAYWYRSKNFQGC